MRDLRWPGVVLPARLLEASFSRSGGPGGQHVNKVETRVDLRLDLDGARAFLGEAGVARVRGRLAGRLDSAGRLFLSCQENRSRARNLADALDRMERLLADALREPKRRRSTRPSRSSRERRLDSKRHRSRIKRQRRDRAE